jgi:hypothetical protein
MVRRIALAGAVVMLGLTACGTASQGWTGPVTDVSCSHTEKEANVFMQIQFAPRAATDSPLVTPADLANEPGYQAIISQTDPSSAARVAESYGWSCSISTP